MPVAKIQLADGRIARFEVPDGTTQEQVMAYAKANSGSFAAPVDQAPEPEAPAVDETFDIARYEQLLKINPQMAQAYASQQTQNTSSKREDVAREEAFAALEKTNPFQAKALREMNPAQAGLISIGAGLTDLSSALPFTENKTQEVRDIESQLSLASPKGEAIGRAAGQSLPALPFSMLASGPASIAARVAGQSAVGAVQGGLIEKGTGGSQSDVIKGSLVGGLIGGGAEALMPIVRRAGTALAARLGVKTKGALLDDLGRPTKEFDSLLEKDGRTFEQFVKDSADTGGDTAKTFARAADTSNVDDIAEVVALAEPSGAKVAAAERLGFDPESVPLGVLTDNQAVQEISGALATRPGTPASTIFDEFVGGLSQKSDDLIMDLGGSIDRGSMSSEVLGGMQDTIKRIKATEGALYSEIREKIGDDLIINAKPIKNLLSSRARTRRGVQNLSVVERDILKLVDDGKMSYSNLDDAISDIGSALGRETDAYSNVRSATLKDMYGKLSEMRAGVAGEFGLKDQLLKAKEIGAKRFALQDASKVLAGKDLQGNIFHKIDSSINKLSKGEVLDFRAKMELIPEEYRQKVLATSLNRALTGGRDSSRQLDSTQFSKWYRNLKRAPNGKESDAFAELKRFAPPSAIQRLDDIYELAHGVSKVKASRVRTGIQLDTFRRIDKTANVVAKLYDTADRFQAVPGAGRAANAAANVAKIFSKESTPSVDAIDALVNTKVFKETMIKAAKSGTDSSAYRAAAAKMKNTKQYKDFITQLDQSRASAIGAAGLVPWLIQEEEE
jgi:hypothetical protein